MTRETSDTLPSARKTKATVDTGVCSRPRSLYPPTSASCRLAASPDRVPPHSTDSGPQPLPPCRGRPHSWRGAPRGLAPSGQPPRGLSAVCWPQGDCSGREGKPAELEEGFALQTLPSRPHPSKPQWETSGREGGCFWEPALRSAASAAGRHFQGSSERHLPGAAGMSAHRTPSGDTWALQVSTGRSESADTRPACAVGSRGDCVDSGARWPGRRPLVATGQLLPAGQCGPVCAVLARGWCCLCQSRTPPSQSPTMEAVQLRLAAKAGRAPGRGVRSWARPASRAPEAAPQNLGPEGDFLQRDKTGWSAGQERGPGGGQRSPRGVPVRPA